jgi:pseudaminic acid cytidylyltransferase
LRRIAIIPARGGSKRIPFKNIKEFAGKPIIAYSIEAALESNLFDVVMVSTDDTDIAKVAISFGASVPFLRSSSNANDHATLIEVLIEVIDKYELLNEKFDEVCCLLATAPFLDFKMIISGNEFLVKGKFDSVFPVVKYSYPIQRALRMNDGKIEMIWPKNLKKRSQDLPTSFHDAGMFYWSKTKSILRKKSLWTNNTGSVTISEHLAHDIDTIEDWKLAELKYKLKLENEKL